MAVGLLCGVISLPLVACKPKIKFDQNCLQFDETFYVASYYDVPENNTYSAKAQYGSAHNGTPKGAFSYATKQPGGEYGDWLGQTFEKDDVHTQVKWINGSDTVCSLPVAPTKDSDLEINVQYYTIPAPTPDAGFKEAKIKYQLRHDTSYFMTDHEREDNKELLKYAETGYACGGAIHVYDVITLPTPPSSSLLNKFRAAVDGALKKVYKCVQAGILYTWDEQGQIPHSNSHISS